jgi:hypothetical protein
MKMNQDRLAKKLKAFLKVFLLGAVLMIVLFGIYRREYLAQAIPVYMQYQKQRSKWEKGNTGTYAYLDRSLNTVFFIEDNNLVKVFTYGKAWESKYVKNVSNSYLYSRAKTDKILQCFFDKKEYLIDKKFDAINHLILRDKMLERYAFLTDCHTSLGFYDFMYYIKQIFTEENQYDKYAYTISYNYNFAYPVYVDAKMINNKHKIVLDMRSPFSVIRIESLIIFPKNTIFTNRVLQSTLDYISRVDRRRRVQRDLSEKTFETVGGDLIKSGIVDLNNTFTHNTLLENSNVVR